MNHVFDVIHKVTETQPLTLESVEQLRQYIQSCYSSSDSSSSHLTNSPPISVSDESAIEKHFMCQSDEERDSWLRILRHARYDTITTFIVDWVEIIIHQPGSVNISSTQFSH